MGIGGAGRQLRRTYETEFPTYDNGVAFRELATRLPTWDDMSWHNDACPCFENKSGDWILWVDFADKEKREAKGKMFTVVKVGAAEAALETDSLDEVVEFCNNLK